MFAYEYRYDSRGRMVMKILPKDSSTGSTTQYWYDRADRMAYMKDPALGSRYRFYLYDRWLTGGLSLCEVNLKNG